jgi:hypothetical protein
MTRDSKCVLLVEGRSDEAFFSAMCARLELNSQVRVAPPKGIGGEFNNKEGVLNHLPLLLRQFVDGRIERLALVLDADHEQASGLGDGRTIDRVTQIVAASNFLPKFPKPPAVGGQLFRSTDGFSDLGLWVMPGTRADGGLEDWVKLCVAPADALMGEAQAAVKRVVNHKFKPQHLPKAEVATWLAWQKAPGRGMESAINEKLLAFDSNSFRQFEAWLKAVFP